MMKYILLIFILTINIFARDVILTNEEKKWIQNNDIVIGTEVWKPIIYKQDNKLQGIIGELLRKGHSHFDKKLNIKIKQGPWKDIFNDFTNHDVDVLPALYYSKDRTKYGNYSKKLFTLNEFIYVKDNSDIENFTDIKNIAIIKGYVMIDKVKKKYPNIKIIQTNNLQESFELLMQNKVQSILDGQIIVEDFLKNNLIIGVKGIYQDSFKANDIYLITNINKPILQSIFAKLIDSISIEERNDILKKYNIYKRENSIDYDLLFKIIFTFIFIILLFLYRQRLLKKANLQLKQAVDLKTKALQNINNNLEKSIEAEILKASKIEKRLFESEKLAAMGEMIGNIAHQWRQPLSVITTTATGLIMQKENNILKDEYLIKNLETINTSAQFLSKTIDDFKDLVKGEANLEIFKLSDLINKCLSIQNSMLISNKIKVITNLDNNIVLTSYPNALIQSIINIFNNAKDALKEHQIKDKYIFVNTYEKHNNVIFEIYDNAGGIPSDVIQRIFEAYFTTKHKSQGTGLGLHMTYNMIKNNLNGTIRVENYEFTYEDKIFKGAKFIISLEITKN